MIRRIGESPPPDRPAIREAYAILVDARWRVAVITHAGALGLPGGALGPEEAPEDALQRLLAQQVSHPAEIAHPLGAWARDEVRDGALFDLHRHYFVCRPTRPPDPASPPVRWLRSSRAMDTLADPVDRLAVRRALSAC